MSNVEKQKSVTTLRYCRNVQKYIDNKDAVLRDGQNLVDIKNWYEEMNSTREVFGHNKPSRRSKDKVSGKTKRASTTYMYHQTLNLLPEEADINGGPMTPEMCMAFAKEYAQIRYPDQQIVFALHKEHCKNDDTFRYAVHMVINRTNLKTGLRLDEGLSKKAGVDRAATVKELEIKWGLSHVIAGEPNSKIHFQQPRNAEKYILDRGEYSYKNNLRQLCWEASARANNLDEYKNILSEWGVKVTVKSHKIYAVDEDKPKYSFKQSNLDPRLNEYRLNSIFKRNNNDEDVTKIENEISAKIQELKTYEEIKTTYVNTIETIYKDYRKEAQKLKGTDYAEFPIIKLPKMPKELYADSQGKRDVQHLIFDYIRKGDNLRKFLSTNAPQKNNISDNTAKTNSSIYQKDRETEEQVNTKQKQK